MPDERTSFHRGTLQKGCLTHPDALTPTAPLLPTSCVAVWYVLQPLWSLSSVLVSTGQELREATRSSSQWEDGQQQAAAVAVNKPMLSPRASASAGTHIEWVGLQAATRMETCSCAYHQEPLCWGSASAVGGGRRMGPKKERRGGRARLARDAVVPASGKSSLLC
mgnify:CR=1 FL=1